MGEVNTAFVNSSHSFSFYCGTLWSG